MRQSKTRPHAQVIIIRAPCAAACLLACFRRRRRLLLQLVQNKHLRCAHLLLHAKCDVNLADSSKNTPLHQAYRRDLPSFVSGRPRACVSGRVRALCVIFL